MNGKWRRFHNRLKPVEAAVNQPELSVAQDATADALGDIFGLWDVQWELFRNEPGTAKQDDVVRGNTNGEICAALDWARGESQHDGSGSLVLTSKSAWVVR